MKNGLILIVFKLERERPAFPVYSDTLYYICDKLVCSVRVRLQYQFGYRLIVDGVPFLRNRFTVLNKHGQVCISGTEARYPEARSLISYLPLRD